MGERWYVCEFTCVSLHLCICVCVYVNPQSQRSAKHLKSSPGNLNRGALLEGLAFVHLTCLYFLI